MSQGIETIARGVCIKGGRILLCRTAGADILYLPGGHVEFNEAARTALEREIDEELGVVSNAGRLLGMIEHSFLQRGEPHCEWNAVFELEIEALQPDVPVNSAEDHLSFCWHKLTELAGINLEPAVLGELLPRWAESAGAVGEVSWITAGDLAQE